MQRFLGRSLPLLIEESIQPSFCACSTSSLRWCLGNRRASVSRAEDTAKTIGVETCTVRKGLQVHGGRTMPRMKRFYGIKVSVFGRIKM